MHRSTKNFGTECEIDLWYIEVAEPEYALSFFKLALVFETLSAKIFSETLLSTVHNTVL